MVKSDLQFNDALVHLSLSDKVLEKVIKGLKPKEPEKREPSFEALVKIITGQQLSGSAASTIFNRLKELFDNKEITPQLINNSDPRKILKCGLSHAKSKYILNLADQFLDNPNFLDEIQKNNPKDIIELLQKFKGIGIWSASIFALFYLHHPDIFVWGDVSIQKAMKLLYTEGGNLGKDRIIKISDNWKPYKSSACLVLWKWLDEGASKYS